MVGPTDSVHRAIMRKAVLRVICAGCNHEVRMRPISIGKKAGAKLSDLTFRCHKCGVRTRGCIVAEG